MLLATLLALLGIPIWLLLGALIGAVFSRHNFKAQPDVVPLMFRAADDDKWPRGLTVNVTPPPAPLAAMRVRARNRLDH